MTPTEFCVYVFSFALDKNEVYHIFSVKKKVIKKEMRVLIDFSLSQGPH